MKKNNFFSGIIKAIQSLMKFIYDKIVALFTLPKHKIKEMLSHNLGLKFFSILLAIMFWAFVMDKVDPEITKVISGVPVTVINRADVSVRNLQVMNDTDYFVSVEVKGRRNRIIQLSSSDITLYADLKSVVAGSNYVDIQSNTNIDNVSLGDIFPAKLNINVDNIITTVKPVKIEYNDEFPSPYYEVRKAISPSEVKVSGPETLVNKVAAVMGNIDVATQTNNFSKEVAIIPVDNNGETVQGVTINPSYSNITVSLGSAKEVPIYITLKGSVAEGYELVNFIPSLDKIKVKAPLSALENIESVDLETLTIDGNNASFNTSLSVKLPAGITTDTESVSVEVQIEKVETREFSYFPNELEIRNLNDSYYVNLDEIDISLAVNGVPSSLNSLSKDDFKLYLDFENVSLDGEYLMKINSPEDTAVSPSEIKVVVKKKGN